MVVLACLYHTDLMEGYDQNKMKFSKLDEETRQKSFMNISKVKNNILTFMKLQTQILDQYKFCTEDIRNWYNKYKDEFPYVKPVEKPKKTR